MGKPANPKVEIKIEDGPDQFVGYANLCRITLTSEEAILHFGARTDADPNKGIGNAKIYLSLPHVKRVSTALLRTIKSYENALGEIRQKTVDDLTLEGKKSLGLIPKDEKKNGKE